MQTRYVILVASARKNGNTKAAANAIAKKTHWDVIDILDYHIEPYQYDHGYTDRDNYYHLIERLLKFDRIIFATPVYWYGMSAQLKTFFDRITDLLKIKKNLGRQLKGKSMGLISCSGSNDRNPHFSEPFKLSAEYLGMAYIGDVHVWGD